MIFELRFFVCLLFLRRMFYFYFYHDCYFFHFFTFFSETWQAHINCRLSAIKKIAKLFQVPSLFYRFNELNHGLWLE